MSACVIWTKSRGTAGYGQRWYLGRLIGAHRAAFHAAFGYWPKVCRHTCDNKLCVNPEHLLAGTQVDNMRDAAERGQLLRGEQRKSAKLTERSVREIKSRLAAGSETHERIAADYGVSRITVTDINAGRTWRHVQKDEHVGVE
jgi:hypothetical protein